MIQVKCIKKFRDDNNRIYGYRVVDLNGFTQDVEAERLKQAIIKGDVDVINMKLTSNGRLIDSDNKRMDIKKLGPTPLPKTIKTVNTSEDILTLVAKAFIVLDSELCNMDSSMAEIAENLCASAKLQFEYSKAINDYAYLNKKLIEAYKILLKTDSETLDSQVEYYTQNQQGIIKSLQRYQSENQTEHKIVKAVKIIRDYTYNECKSGRLSTDLYTNIHDLYTLISKIDTKTCQFGYKIGKSLTNYVNPKYFDNISNIHTIGRIVYDPNEISLYGSYIIEIRMKDLYGNKKYRLSLNRLNSTEVVIKFYREITVTLDSREKVNVMMDTEKRMVLPYSYAGNAAEVVAKKLSRLASSDLKNDAWNVQG